MAQADTLSGMDIWMPNQEAQAVTVPAVPPLATIPGVELMHTGEWDISTGTATFTQDDLASAVAALDCPAIRRPVLKLGHTDIRFDGEPACGWVANMATADSGNTLVGDYVGMPGWLGEILPSAYPDRSIEGAWNFQCQIGHTHDFVITAVAFLGVTPPGIGTLESLQDIAAMYGVAASQGGSGETVVIHAKGSDMPKFVQVQAAVTTEDIRREYYAANPEWDTWICEMQMDPLQIIVANDADGSYSRVPVEVNGEDSFTFGEPVKVKMVYQDLPAAASATVGERITYASREESQSGLKKPPEPEEEPAKATSKSAPNKLDAIQQIHKASKDEKGAGMDPGKIREALGLSPEASDDDVLAAVKANAGKTPEPPKVEPEKEPAAGVDLTKLPEGVMVLDSSVVKSLQAQAARGDQAYKEIQRNRRDDTIRAAIEQGKFPPAREEHWRQLWDADPVGTEGQIKNLAAGLVPMAATGYPGTETFEQDLSYYGLYPEEKPNG